MALRVAPCLSSRAAAPSRLLELRSPPPAAIRKAPTTGPLALRRTAHIAKADGKEDPLFAGTKEQLRVPKPRPKEDTSLIVFYLGAFFLIPLIIIALPFLPRSILSIS